MFPSIGLASSSSVLTMAQRHKPSGRKQEENFPEKTSRQRQDMWFVSAF